MTDINGWVRDIVIAILFFIFLLACGKAWGIDIKSGDELYYPESNGKHEYTVKPGDTLGTIAQKLYGSSNQWKKLWDFNRHIKNPDRIYPGQKIFTDRPSYGIDDIETMAKKVFKIRGFGYVEKAQLVHALRKHQEAFGLYSMGSLSPHGFICRIDEISNILYRLELYDVVESVYQVTKGDDWGDFRVLLLALIWQESCFRNRDGALGEKGYCQWRISSAILLRQNMSREELAHDLEFDTEFSVTLTYEYLTSLYNKYGNWRDAIRSYNGSGPNARKYASSVIAKFHRIKSMNVD